MCQNTEQGGRGQIKRRAQGRCRSQRADLAARDGPDPAAGSGSCEIEKPDRGAAGLSGEAGVGPGVRWRDHCSNKDPLEDGGAGPGRGRTVQQGRPGGRWRDHCSNEGFTLPLGSFCLHRKNYSPRPSFCSFQLLSTPTGKKIRLPPSPFAAHLPPLPKVFRLLFIALHLASSPKVPCLLFVALRLSIGPNKETKGDEEEAEDNKGRQRLTRYQRKDCRCLPMPVKEDSSGMLHRCRRRRRKRREERKEGFGRCIEGRVCRAKKKGVV